MRRSIFLKQAGLAAILSLAASAALADAAPPKEEADAAPAAAVPAGPLAASKAGAETTVADNAARFATRPARVARVGPRGSSLRAPIDARIVNITFINRSRNPPDTYAATTAQAIDRWTSTVFYGSASGLGTPVDQWVAMVDWLDR